MKKLISRPLALFFVISFLLAAIFFLFPINLFYGEVVLRDGISLQTVEVPLSLSYFIGIGYDQADLGGIEDFYLTIRGYLTAFLFILCVPALVAYRVHLGNKNKTN